MIVLSVYCSWRLTGALCIYALCACLVLLVLCDCACVLCGNQIRQGKCAAQQKLQRPKLPFRLSACLPVLASAHQSIGKTSTR